MYHFVFRGGENCGGCKHLRASWTGYVSDVMYRCNNVLIEPVHLHADLMVAIRRPAICIELLGG